jgi:class 3 adenylate cyclase
VDVPDVSRAAELGHQEWRNRLERHNEIVRTELARFRGFELDTAGDGFFASFELKGVPGEWRPFAVSSP